jgi:hypothetical protein
MLWVINGGSRVFPGAPEATSIGTAMPPTSERRITRDGDSMHAPALARIIVERAVPGAAVVPDRPRTASQRNRQVNSG